MKDWHIPRFVPGRLGFQGQEEFGVPLVRRIDCIVDEAEVKISSASNPARKWGCLLLVILPILLVMVPIFRMALLTAQHQPHALRYGEALASVAQEYFDSHKHWPETICDIDVGSLDSLQNIIPKDIECESGSEKWLWHPGDATKAQRKVCDTVCREVGLLSINYETDESGVAQLTVRERDFRYEWNWSKNDWEGFPE